MMELPWIANGRALIGISEVKGSKHNPEIVQMWKDIKRGGIKDDETRGVPHLLEQCWNVLASGQPVLSRPNPIWIGAFQ